MVADLSAGLGIVSTCAPYCRLLLSRIYFGIQVLLLHLMSQAQWMDSKSSDGSDANALAPVLGDGEVD